MYICMEKKLGRFSVPNDGNFYTFVVIFTWQNVGILFLSWTMEKELYLPWHLYCNFPFYYVFVDTMAYYFLEHSIFSMILLKKSTHQWFSYLPPLYRHEKCTHITNFICPSFNEPMWNLMTHANFGFLCHVHVQK